MLQATVDFSTYIAECTRASTALSPGREAWGQDPAMALQTWHEALHTLATHTRKDLLSHLCALASVRC